jgi:hypothetical protein
MKTRYTLTPYAGNKSQYEPILDHYDTIIDVFAGGLGGTLQTAIANPQARYYVAESSNCQRALIKQLTVEPGNFDLVRKAALMFIDRFFEKTDYPTACKWLSTSYQVEDYELGLAALSVMRRFFFSSILRTTPGSGEINVWISVRKILGDPAWKAACKSLYEHTDYTKLTTAETKEFNANLGQALFENGLLKKHMQRSVESWYKSIQPLLYEWFAEPRFLTVVDDYHKLLDSSLIQGKVLCYVDPPYWNDNTGTFLDEAGRKRYHKQTSSYEHHDPRSEATWLMFQDCVDWGVVNGCDLVVCNYGSDAYRSAIEKLKKIYELEVVVENKSCWCTGKRSKYTAVPVGKESVYFCYPKVQVGAIAA